jgi:predicted ester cyclase
VLRFNAGMAKGDTSVVDQLTTPNFVQHNLTLGIDADKETTKQGNKRAHIGLSDVSLELEDIIAEGDLVAVRWTFTAKHTGQMFNVAPTNNDVNTARVMFFRLENGKIAELWMLSDYFKLFQDMGAISPFNEIGK